MGLYRPIIERAQSGEKPADFEPSKKIITVPSVVTATRVPLALTAAKHLIRGEKGATRWVLATWASDMEGIPGRYMDVRYPELDLGSSEFGAKADVAADLAAAMIISMAVILGPNVTKGAKFATSMVLGKEGVKAVWYMNKNRDFRDALADGGLPDTALIIPVDNDGKEALVEGAGALTSAAATNDYENPYARLVLTSSAIMHGVSSLKRGENIRRHYNELANDWITQAAQGVYPYAA